MSGTKKPAETLEAQCSRCEAAEKFLEDFKKLTLQISPLEKEIKAFKLEKERIQKKNQALTRRVEELQDLCSQQKLRASEREEKLLREVAELKEKLARYEMGACPKTSTLNTEKDKKPPCSKKKAGPKTVRSNPEDDEDSGQGKKSPEEESAESTDLCSKEARERSASVNVANRDKTRPWRFAHGQDNELIHAHVDDEDETWLDKVPKISTFNTEKDKKPPCSNKGAGPKTVRSNPEDDEDSGQGKKSPEEESAESTDLCSKEARGRSASVNVANRDKTWPWRFVYGQDNELLYAFIDDEDETWLDKVPDTEQKCRETVAETPKESNKEAGCTTDQQLTLKADQEHYLSAGCRDQLSPCKNAGPKISTFNTEKDKKPPCSNKGAGPKTVRSNPEDNEDSGQGKKSSEEESAESTDLCSKEARERSAPANAANRDKTRPWRFAHGQDNELIHAHVDDEDETWLDKVPKISTFNTEKDKKPPCSNKGAGPKTVRSNPEDDEDSGQGKKSPEEESAESTDLCSKEARGRSASVNVANRDKTWPWRFVYGQDNELLYAFIDDEDETWLDKVPDTEQKCRETVAETPKESNKEAGCTTDQQLTLKADQEHYLSAGCRDQLSPCKNAGPKISTFNTEKDKKPPCSNKGAGPKTVRSNPEDNEDSGQGKKSSEEESAESTDLCSKEARERSAPANAANRDKTRPWRFAHGQDNELIHAHVDDEDETWLDKVPKISTFNTEKDKKPPCSNKGAGPKTVSFNPDDLIIEDDEDSSQGKKSPEEESAESTDLCSEEAQGRSASVNVANQDKTLQWRFVYCQDNELIYVYADDEGKTWLYKESDMKQKCRETVAETPKESNNEAGCTTDQQLTLKAVQEDYRSAGRRDQLSLGKNAGRQLLKPPKESNNEAGCTTDQQLTLKAVQEDYLSAGCRDQLSPCKNADPKTSTFNTEKDNKPPCSNKGAGPKTVRSNPEDFIIEDDEDSGQGKKSPEEESAESTDLCSKEARERSASVNVANQDKTWQWPTAYTTDQQLKPPEESNKEEGCTSDQQLTVQAIQEHYLSAGRRNHLSLGKNAGRQLPKPPKESNNEAGCTTDQQLTLKVVQQRDLRSQQTEEKMASKNNKVPLQKTADQEEEPREDGEQPKKKKRKGWKKFLYNIKPWHWGKK